LLAHHHAVIYASGAPNDRRLDVDGMGLPGTGTATELVAWINGHPDFTDLPVDLSHERVIVVGNGNVAFDVARVLTADPDALAHTDISDHALTALRASRVQEVVIAARRGPEHSAFTLPELIGLTTTADVVLSGDDREAVLRDLATVADPLTRQKLEILSKLGDASMTAGPAARPRIRLAYNLTPQRISGEQRATGMEFVVTGTDEVQTIEAGLVLTSIGYHGKAIKDLPFDDKAGVVPNNGGRVTHSDSGKPVDGAYVAGWIKRGPTGFIGTNKSCALETVQRLVDDYNAGTLRNPIGKPLVLDKLVRARQPDVVDAAGWRAIDAAEVARGESGERPRNKFTAVAEMLDVAAAAPTPPLHRRLADRLRELADL
jgi:ferredoxin--NADP+ reductase